MNKVEIYKYLIQQALSFEYMEDVINKIWEVIAWDEQLKDSEIDMLGDFITDNTNLHFTC